MIHVQVKEKTFYIRILDDARRIIYENQCINRIHYECVRYALTKLINGDKTGNSILKPLQKINHNKCNILI